MNDKTSGGRPRICASMSTGTPGPLEYIQSLWLLPMTTVLCLIFLCQPFDASLMSYLMPWVYRSSHGSLHVVIRWETT
ncbi:hypothetical protein ASPWEDRAFT_45057 [Aspergillus wentii DTO 134E9]|uniref:Uncharacterized protein n=1 Tax=Aspergillus wentii DTO 134E9 TaxID=1073089 RepID=A0A1L9R878_ASPWE|nr:uncharacterized protein ASPWEDRAFT_45057 [Aspergillus wentii DTO 134E9]OJJ31104.1 hypothetical protein ASPWEDRAFT_45057 [Aspergillus wentii DTO 134E9]